MSDVPNIPIGDGPMFRWCRAVHDRVFNSGRILMTPNMRVNQTSRGIQIMPKPQRAGGSAVSDVQCVVVSESVNTLTCKLVSAVTIDPVTGLMATGTTGATITVAKPPELQGAVASKSVTYSGITDLMAIVPAYQSGSIIYACQPTGGTSVSTVTYQDLNSAGRQWGVLTQTCESINGSPVTKNRFFVCSQAS